VRQLDYDPCPYCGTPYVTSYFYVDREREREIADHPCAAFAQVEPLPAEPTDTSFIREARNTAEGHKRWKDSLE